MTARGFYTLLFGAILMITHDRKLIKEAATRVLKLTEAGLVPFDASAL